nr:MAG TPA: hypothetical protein [Bacteriophage sp.]
MEYKGIKQLFYSFIKTNYSFLFNIVTIEFIGETRKK